MNRCLQALRRLCVLPAIVVAGGLGSAQALAQVASTEPGAVPLKLLVGFGAGGSTDVLARLMAAQMKASLGRNVIVENRPGASGRIAAEALKAAPADGSVMMLAPMVIAVLAPVVFRQPGYDPATDFAPVSQVAKFQFAFAVAVDHPARDLAAYFEWVRAAPGRDAFGTIGAGGLPQFLGLSMGRAAGVQMTHVPYSAIGTMSANVIGGQLPACIDAISNLIELHRSGKLRILATSGTTRSPLLPGVPTIREQGLPTIEGHTWFGLFAPAKTPRATIERVSAAAGEALRSTEVVSRLLPIGLEPAGTTPDELAAIMAADAAHWIPIVKASGFVAE